MLTFEPLGHIYRWDGVIKPSVTTALKIGGIIDYSHIPQSVLQVAAVRGTAVHLATQLFDEDRLNESTLDALIGGYLEGWKAFLRDTGFQPGRIEERIYNTTYGYAGTFDRVGLFGSQIACVDIKSGILLDGHRNQLAAYTMAMPMPRRYRRMAVQLTKDGRYRMAEYPTVDLSGDFNKFLGALAKTKQQLKQQQEGLAA